MTTTKNKLAKIAKRIDLAHDADATENFLHAILAEHIKCSRPFEVIGTYHLICTGVQDGFYPPMYEALNYYYAQPFDSAAASETLQGHFLSLDFDPGMAADMAMTDFENAFQAGKGGGAKGVSPDALLQICACVVWDYARNLRFSVAGLEIAPPDCAPLFDLFGIKEELQVDAMTAVDTAAALINSTNAEGVLTPLISDALSAGDHHYQTVLRMVFDLDALAAPAASAR